MKLTKKEVETLNQATIVMIELIGCDLIDEDTIESVCKGLDVDIDSNCFYQAREVAAKLMREQNER
jgi:hypothetical protein